MKAQVQVNGVIVSILEGLGDACLLLDDAGRIIFANEKTRALFTLRRVIRNIRLTEIINDARILALVHEVEESGEPTEREFLVKLKRGRRMEERYLAVNVAPIRLDKSNQPYLRILLRDQTERHATDQVRKDFVANASHELRTPLSIINGYLENLVDGVIDDDAMVRKCLLTMRKHGERIARIVEDMLTLSKFESEVDEVGARSLRQTKFSCRECVYDVLERLQPLIESKMAVVKVEIDSAADALAGDRFYWDQIFFNLIENALKENAPGISITLLGQRDGDKITLTVSDNGVGIPAEDIPFVFKRFYRVAKHHSQQVKGTGLGLSIVRRAVEAHGGSISVHSIPGQITSFIIVMPDESEPPRPKPFALST